MKKPVGRVTLKSRKKRSQSSRDWLLRQLNDPYVQKAKQVGYRSRSAFKLLEIDEKYKIFKPGQRVIDLGAAPGGWTQVIAKKVLPKGMVVALDLQAIEPFAEQVTVIVGDFEDETVQQQILGHMQEVDVIVSDMAAAACGIPAVDHLRINNLLGASINFATHHLVKGGAFVAKVLMGGTEALLLKLLKTHFEHVCHFKPNASRKDSAEMYVVARGFRGR